jgi:hypothetical protein
MVDLPGILSRMRCPVCQRLSNTAARTAQIIADPTLALRFVPARDRPLRVMKWTCTTDLRIPGRSPVVSITAIMRLGPGDGEVLTYELEITTAGRLVSAMQFGGMIGCHIERHEISPHILDLAQSIALDVGPVRDWQAFAREATAPLRDGEGATA